MTEETKRKISEAMKGKKKAPFSEKHIKHLSESHLGQKPSEEQLRKQSLRMMGNKLCVGRPTSKHQKEVASRIHKGNKYRESLVSPMKGKQHLEETKQKISLSKIGKKTTDETKKKISNSHMGDKSWNWIKDRTQVVGRHNRNMHDPEYKQFAYKVRNRDEYKCKINNQDCVGRLEVHHILGWKSHPELRYEVNNGITLCHFHHPRKRNDEVRLSPYFQELVNAKV